MTKRSFNASIWLHALGGQVQSIELLTIGGYDVEMDFVRYLERNNSDLYLFRCFAGMEIERAYNVTGVYWFEDGDFDIEITGYVEVVPVELPEQPDGYPLPGVAMASMWDIFGV